MFWVLLAGNYLYLTKRQIYQQTCQGLAGGGGGAGDDEDPRKEQHELESVVEGVGSPPARMADGNLVMAAKNNTVGRKSSSSAE